MTPISVILPVRDGARFYATAMASVRAQGWSGLEIIVVDDGSCDGLDDIVGDDPVVYLRQAPRGPAAARNAGLARASTALIAFLDIDDRWTPGHLERLHDALVAQPEAGFAQGRMQQFVIAPDGRLVLSGAYRMPYLGACLFRRETLQGCGGFDETMRLGEDYDLILRCWERDIPKAAVAEVSLLYQRHADNMTRGKNQQASLEIMRRRLDRIRTGALDPDAPRTFPFAEYIGSPAGMAAGELGEPALCLHA